jgi:hypothetical protein
MRSHSRRSGTRSSSTNRDRRDQSFARSVIAEATRRHNIDARDTNDPSGRTLAETGMCCGKAHANAVPPWTCDCPCHEREIPEPDSCLMCNDPLSGNWIEAELDSPEDH